MNYELIMQSIVDDEIINYGIINGNETIFFIKTGQDGDIYGYENKYLLIANNINKKKGYTVICSSNPFRKTNPLDDAMNKIENYAKENNFNNYIVYYMGVSNGARLGMTYGYKYPQIKKMLLINSPIQFNWPQAKEGIKQISEEQTMNIVFGELDQSYKYIELLKPLLKDNIKLDILKDVDHQFTNKLNEFIELPDKYL